MCCCGFLVLPFTLSTLLGFMRCHHVLHEVAASACAKAPGEDGCLVHLPTGIWVTPLVSCCTKSDQLVRLHTGRLRNVYEADNNGQPLFDPVIELSSEEIRDVHNLNMAFGSECAVNAFPPSSNGFCDVFGNAWQWCEDNFAALPDR